MLYFALNVLITYIDHVASTVYCHYIHIKQAKNAIIGELCIFSSFTDSSLWYLSLKNFIFIT